MQVNNTPTTNSSSTEASNYNIPSVKNNLKQALYHFTSGIESLVHNPDQINETNLQNLTASIKELKKQADLGIKAPLNTPMGQTLHDSSTIIHNALEAPIDV